MNDNRSLLRILGMTVTFILFAAIGYFIPFEKMLGSQQPDQISQQVGGGGGGSTTNVSPVVPTQTGQQPATDGTQQQVPPQQVPQQQNDQQQGAQQTDASQTTVDPVPVVDPNNVPVIERAWVAPHKKSKVQLGYPVSVEAAAPSGDELVYELWQEGASKAAYTSTNGYFGNVNPVDGGTYELQVKNARTGDVTKQELRGFNKVQKMSAAKLQAQLNADVQEDLFFFHFDLNKLQITYSGIDPSEYPANLNALLLDRASIGWNLEVVGTPQYDKYNRIVSFKLNVTYL